MPPLDDAPNNPLLARLAGFSLHAATVCEAWQRARLKRPCRYITRPPIATKRLSVDGRGWVVYRYKQPFRDGSTHVVLDPLDFIARLAALVPRPRLNLTCFHGVFAPNLNHRNHIVLRRPRHVDADIPPAPMSWMQRLRRVFAFDIATCPECGGMEAPDGIVYCGGGGIKHQIEYVNLDHPSDQWDARVMVNGEVRRAMTAYSCIGSNQSTPEGFVVALLAEDRA